MFVFVLECFTILSSYDGTCRDRVASHLYVYVYICFNFVCSRKITFQMVFIKQSNGFMTGILYRSISIAYAKEKNVFKCETSIQHRMIQVTKKRNGFFFG